MKAFENPIYVARPSLPPLAEFARRLEEIWVGRWLTNRGRVLERFEQKLAQVLQTENLSLFTNGTLALQVGLQGLGLVGEVITTPFTFPASANALVQNGLVPVFADIEPIHFTLNPECVAAAISPRTTAILAVHVFGIPCDLERLATIAARHGLVLIYDAAHAFGVTVDGKSIGRFGDLSMFSFHATKPFHSIEGGALTFTRPELKRVFDRLSNHGLEPDGNVPVAGTNAKMTEFQALMGELMLDRVAPATAHAGRIEAVYRECLAVIPGIKIPPWPGDRILSNHSFMPVLVKPDGFGMASADLQAALARFNVFPKRYFHPIVSDMTGYSRLKAKAPLDHARKTAEEVLALPIYADLALADVGQICELIAHIQRVGPGAAPATPLTDALSARRSARSQAATAGHRTRR
jgi:dTDP-4-amino-4,6-dideoxygalactose transaminase